MKPKIRYILLMLFMLFCSNSKTQNIEEPIVFFRTITNIQTSTLVAQNRQEIDSLQSALSRYCSEERDTWWYSRKDNAYKLLSLDKYNNDAIWYLFHYYQESNKNDSIPILLNNLIKNNKDEVEPYLIKEKYCRYENLNHLERITNLKNVLKIDASNENANYVIGKLYYECFLNEYKNDKKKDSLNNYAKNTIHYFTTLYEKEKYYKEVLKYPLLQMANYLGDNTKKKLYESFKQEYLYFPMSAFVNLPNGWQTNYSINVIEYCGDSFGRIGGSENALNTVNIYSRLLKTCNEPALNNSLSAEIYRFIFLPSFHNPIIVSLVNQNDTIKIYWNVIDRRGKLSVSDSKNLSKKDWIDFEKLINDKKFWDMKTLNDIWGYDGATWLLESKKLGKYHVVKRWGGDSIRSICERLIKLTDVDTKDIELY